MKLFIIITFLLTFSLNSLCGQNDYYRFIRSAEQKIISNELDSALFYYNHAFEKYSYPFVKDVLAAACVCVHTQDTVTLYRYLEFLLSKGMVKREFDYFIDKRPKDTRLQSLHLNFDIYNKIYLKSFDYSLNKKFRDLDKDDQIGIIYRKQKIKDKKSKIEDRKKQYEVSVNHFIGLVKKYGFPSERMLGLGSPISLLWSNDKKTKFYSLTEKINEPDLRIKRKDSVYFCYTHSKYPSISRLLNRRGNSLLWHTPIDRFPELDSLLLSAIEALELYPQFYAACRERRGDDYGLAMGSKVNWKYNFDIRKIANSPEAIEINKNRARLGIRSLDFDVKLFDAISKLDQLKYKHFFRTKTKGRSLFFMSLFTLKMP